MVEAFAVASGKGGTGKTTSTLALGMALADEHDVTVVDADTGMANLLFHAGLDDAAVTLHDLLVAGTATEVGEATYERFGLSVVPCGTSLGLRGLEARERGATGDDREPEPLVGRLADLRRGPRDEQVVERDRRVVEAGVKEEVRHPGVGVHDRHVVVGRERHPERERARRLAGAALPAGDRERLDHTTARRAVRIKALHRGRGDTDQQLSRWRVPASGRPRRPRSQHARGSRSPSEATATDEVGEA